MEHYTLDLVLLHCPEMALYLVMAASLVVTTQLVLIPASWRRRS